MVAGDEFSPCRVEGQQNDVSSMSFFRNGESLRSSIYRVLKQVHPDIGISRIGIGVVQDVLTHVFTEIVNQVRA